MAENSIAHERVKVCHATTAFTKNCDQFWPGTQQTEAKFGRFYKLK